MIETLTAKHHSPTTPPETIVDRVANFVERLVFLRDRRLYKLLAAWIIATYLYADFDYIGAIFAWSPEPQSGKSRLLETLDLLVHNSSHVMVAPSPAVLFRTASGSTQLLDEVDSWRNSDDLRSILNAGFQKVGKVKRMEMVENRYEPLSFDVYCPRALAGIGKKILNATTRDRTFGIAMERQRKEERRERLQKAPRADAAVLKRDIESWVKANRDQVRDVYERGDFPYLEPFRDRTIDISQSIAAIVEVAYKGAEELESHQRELVGAIAVTREDHEEPADCKILRELIALGEEEIIGSASEIAERLPKHLRVGLYEVSAMLRKHEFSKRSTRKDGDGPRYRYVVSRARLIELLARYGSEEEEDASETPVSTTTDYTPATAQADALACI